MSSLSASLDELVASVKAPVVAKMRAMTPLDVDTAVGCVFVVLILGAQVGLVVLARLLARLAGPAREGREAKADGAIEGKKGEPAAHVEADVAGFAWMKAAGVTLPQEACVLRVYPPPPGPRARFQMRARLPNDRRSAPPPSPPPPGLRRARPHAPRDPLPTPLQTHTATPRTPRRRRNPPRRGPRPGLEPRPGPPPPDALLPGHRPPEHYSMLGADEIPRLRELRALVKRAAEADPDLLGTPELRRFVNDACLCRYLRARQWSPRRAMKALTATLRWRARARPESISYDDVEDEGASGKQYVAGRDQRGRNVLVMRPGRENTREHAGNIRFLVYTLENATWRDSPASDPPRGAFVSHDAEKLVILIDFTGWTLATAPPMKTSRETLSILQDHFPERLAVAVCYNPPWIFAVFWKAISPFIDPATYRKIRFVNPKRAKEMNRMRAMFDMSVIDEDMGGRRDATFDPERFRREMKAQDKRRALSLSDWE